MNSRSIPNEASQLAILKSEASKHDKAIACQHLAHVAGTESVAPLAALLDDDHLSDYARSGLEVIDDPAAAAALLDALPTLEGRQLAGAINSLGIRRETKAVAPLVTLVASLERKVQSEAIAALGMIGNTDAAKALTVALETLRPPLKTEAGHAALIAAEHLAKEGHQATASKLLQAVKSTFPKGPIHDAATHLS